MAYLMDTRLGVLLIVGLFHSITSTNSNGIIGDIQIKCISDRIEVSFNTQTAFKGRVFVQGVDDPVCSQEFSQNRYPDAALTIPMEPCQTDTQASDGGYRQSTMLMISFHRIFMTKDDIAILVDCVQPEHQRNVSQRLQVGTDLTTLKMMVEKPAPDIWYSLHLNDADGSQIYFAELGDTVVHKWETTSEDYGILVHSCQAMTSGMKPVNIIDENGCPLDEDVFPQLVYSDSVQQATASTRAFKFQKSADLTFQCKVDFCIRARQLCQNKIPPNCSNGSIRRIKRTDGSITKTVISPRLFIADTNSTNNHNNLLQQRHISTCSTNYKLLVLITVPLIMVILATSTIVVMLIAKLNVKHKRTQFKTDLVWNNSSEC